MLTRRLRTVTIAAACVAALAAPSGAEAADKKAPKKHWEELRDDPIDYAPFEKRRAENLKSGTAPITQAFANGFATAADLGDQKIVITDEALTKGLVERAKKLLPETMGIKAPPMEFVVIDDLGFIAAARATGQGNPAIDVLLKRDEAIFTARATPGGAIVIGLSVLKSVRSYEEMDFIVGHEMSHVLFDHFTEDEKKATIAKIIAVGVLIATLATQRSDSNTQENVAWAALGLIVANGLLQPAWDREQEGEADELGYEFLMEAGLSAEGANNVFDKFQKQEEAQKEFLDVMCGPDSAGDRFFKGLLGSVLGISIPEQGYAPYSPVCKERRDLFASLFREHPEVKERREGIEKHSKKFYADLPPRTVTPLGDGSVSLLQFLSPNGDANRLVLAYDGLKAVHAGDWALARSIAKQVPSRGPSEVHVPVLELQFHVANAEGKRAEALRYLETAMVAPQAAQYIFLLAEQEYIKDRRWGDAARVLELAVRRGLATRPQILIKLISYLRLAGDMARMQAVLAECMAMNQPGMTLACQATAYPPQPVSPPAPAPGVPPDGSPAPTTPPPASATPPAVPSR